MADNEQSLAPLDGADYDNSRLTHPIGLNSLMDLQRKVRMDSRRSVANVGLNKSMQSWVARKSPHHGQDGVDFLATSPKGSDRMSSMAPRKGQISKRRMSMEDECILGLEQAFKAHSAAFDFDGEGTICVEELIIIFDRCYLFDAFFTPNKVRAYFNTWVDGCNHVLEQAIAMSDRGIGYGEFKDVLQWAADMKSQSITDCAQKVVRLSRKLCDKSASVQRRLELVFDATCKKNPQYMSAFEFGNLCQKVNAYQQDKFSTGDVYSFFYQINGDVHGKGVDFDGFISVLAEVGKRLNIGEEVYTDFARGVELLDSDEETVQRVKMRLKQGAIIVGGTDWRQFFYACDPDGSGSIDWDEFMVMCREKMHLADRDSHLRKLFDRLDQDGSGQLYIPDLVAFISDGDVSAEAEQGRAETEASLVNNQ